MRKLWELRKRTDVKKLLPLLLIGILLFAAAGVLNKEETSEDADLSLTSSYSKELEARVQKICGEIDGVGDCTVMITLSGKIKRTYSGGTLISEEPPEVLGVTVVCEGGGRASVKRDVTELLTALFGIGSNRISVLAAK